MKEQLEGVRHDYIRYANCWEDADVLRKGLQIAPGEQVLSIGSAGDNSFSLLLDDPKLVVAVDINEIQLNLIELKKAAIKALNHSEYERFVGFQESNERAELFEKVKTFLSQELQDFWSGRMDEIEAGIIYEGKFERYFLMFSKKILPLIHTKKRIAQLFEAKSEAEQISFHNKKWYNWRWKTLFRLFFSRFVMGRLGRDPQFLKEVEGSVSSFILGQAKRHLSSKHCQNNYFLRFILTGDFGELRPNYVRKENYDIIKSRIDRVEVFNGLAEDAFKQYQGGFDKFNLSNIFEYMNPELFAQVVQNLVENGNKGARYGYWNLMVPRILADVSDELTHESELSATLKEEDYGFFYAGVRFDQKN